MPFCGYHYVYVLASESDPARHYTGCTTDLTARLARHNAGGVPHTAKHRPWRLETAVAFRDKSIASRAPSICLHGVEKAQRTQRH